MREGIYHARNLELTIRERDWNSLELQAGRQLRFIPVTLSSEIVRDASYAGRTFFVQTALSPESLTQGLLFITSCTRFSGIYRTSGARPNGQQRWGPFTPR